MDLKRGIRSEIKKGGRERLLDLRDAVGYPAEPPKPTVAMNDVFTYGFEAAVDTRPDKTKIKAAEPVTKARRRQQRRQLTIGQRIWIIGQYPLIAAIAIGAAYSTSIGQWFVLAYAIYAIWRKLDSRYAFGAAIFLLVTVPLFQALGQSGIAQNAAVYVFELLVIGTIQAVIELRKTGDLPS